jgi:hypothetical protein
MQPELKQPIQNRGSIINPHNKYSSNGNGNGNGIKQGAPAPIPTAAPASATMNMSSQAIHNILRPKPKPKPQPQPSYRVQAPQQTYRTAAPGGTQQNKYYQQQAVPHQLAYHLTPNSVYGRSEQQTTPPHTQSAPQMMSDPSFGDDYGYGVYENDGEMTPDQIEQALVVRDQADHQGMSVEEDEREFVGGKKLYDRQLMQQPMYDEPTMQILNDIASDESFPVLVQYITQLSHLGRQAQARLIARASAFQSKNQVFSNIQNLNDYMMAQDDFTYAQILSKADYSTYDMNADYFTAEAIMEAQFNIRLRRSKNALNLLQLNTQRQESVMGSHPQQEEEQKLRRKIPYLGQFLG